MLFFMPSSSSSSQSQHDFLESLENERRKIQMFSRELPLTLHLINREIDSLRTQIATSDAQLFNCTPDLLTSVNLNHTIADETPLDERGTLRKPVAVNARRVVCGAFQPFERNKLVTAPSVSSTTVMTVERRKDGEVVEEEDEKKQTLVDSMGSNRKNRRCWSPDLHRKFLNALEVLGGSHVATPKQIREMMKVDSLTNDEVKSHLQKYRLHTKRPAAATAHNCIATRTPPHFVLLGNIWAPPHEYTSAATERTEGSVAALKETYSPAASLPLELRLQEEQSAKKQQRNRPSSGTVHPERMISQDDDSLLDDAATKSNSPSSSFSSQTTTVSPPL